MSTTTTEPIRLRYREKDSQVMIEPEDEDRFSLFVEQAIKACRMFQDIQLFNEQLDHLKARLGKWVHDRAGKIHKAFLTIADNQFLFLVVLKEAEYDDEFEEELAELDLDIARDPDCSRMNLDVQSLPICGENGYTSFCNPLYTAEYRMPDA
jgi:hypothetical protein